MTKADVTADNGVIHFLNGVILYVPLNDTLQMLSRLAATQHPLWQFSGFNKALELLNAVGTLTGCECS
jgi:hypothetical protein